MSSILVVEDTELVQEFIRDTLEFGGYDDVSFATSGKEAIQFCHDRAIDLVITDVMMPDMGFELILSLRDSHPDLRILAVSGGSDDLLEMAKALGAIGILAKPFGPDDLLAMVGKILGKAMEDNYDLRTLTIICPNCQTVISYAAEETNAYGGTCPNCKTAIPELRGAMIVAFDSPEKDEKQDP
jgi:two-component system, chemotaxis family, chemotaxis protein CheY